MIHSVITCDKCNPDGNIHASPVNRGRGIFEGSWTAAKELGWKALPSMGQLCIECQEEEP